MLWNLLVETIGCSVQCGKKLSFFVLNWPNQFHISSCSSQHGHRYYTTDKRCPHAHCAVTAPEAHTDTQIQTDTKVFTIVYLWAVSDSLMSRQTERPPGGRGAGQPARQCRHSGGRARYLVTTETLLTVILWTAVNWICDLQRKCRLTSSLLSVSVVMRARSSPCWRDIPGSTTSRILMATQD